MCQTFLSSQKSYFSSMTVGSAYDLSHLCNIDLTIDLTIDLSLRFRYPC